MRRILLTGIPGSGKTTLGAHLGARHGFEHLDFERKTDIERFLTRGEQSLLEELARVERNGSGVVISWGFIPEGQLPSVLTLRERGYDWIWLDGDREAARRAFLARGTSTQRALETQMRAIAEHVDLDRMRPRIVEPFDEHGEFRPLEEVAAEILRPA